MHQQPGHARGLMELNDTSRVITLAFLMLFSYVCHRKLIISTVICKRTFLRIYDEGNKNLGF